MKKYLSEGFEPAMLIEAVRNQAADLPWLSEALEKCGHGDWESRAYVRYVSSNNPNQPGSDWQFDTNVVLLHEELGTVVLDILKGNRLGGIEFVDRLDDQSAPKFGGVVIWFLCVSSVASVSLWLNFASSCPTTEAQTTQRSHRELKLGHYPYFLTIASRLFFRDNPNGALNFYQCCG